MSELKVRRFGVLTNGGDAPGLNAAVRAVCLSAEKKGMQAVGIRNGYSGLVSGEMEELSGKNLQEIFSSGGTVLGTSRYKPFKSPEKNPETGLYPAEAIVRNIEKWNLDAVVCMGGNGTNTTANLLRELGLNVIGLPKTIDNDIVLTDVTFGFQSAVEVASSSIDRLVTTAKSHGRIMLVEIMGHKTGWLALEAGLGGGADAVLIPEIPYDPSSLAAFLSRRADERGFAMVAVAEGAKDLEEARLGKKELKARRAKSGLSVCGRISAALSECGVPASHEIRSCSLGYLQRGGSPCAYDRVLASRLGMTAADFLEQGKFGVMAAVQNGEIVGVPLSDVAGKVKNVPRENELVKTALALGVSFGRNDL
ncbi:MAG: 6-phosphofructokinase [Treponema sp.]|nr:6-phosphofructokinase [Treponema sp.]